MNELRFYKYLKKQILLLIGLTLIPGLAYVLLGWAHGVLMPALLWYGLAVIISVWGYLLSNSYVPEQMSKLQIDIWYRKLKKFFYAAFTLWTLIFLLYVNETESNLHYIAIFTQLGASVVASTLLVADKKLFINVLLILMVPLIIYFGLIGEGYGYVLSLFASVFLGVLFYASNSSYTLLKKTDYQATHDYLTGLYNRRYFIDDLQQLILSLKQSRNVAYLLLIDLDHFKTINDSLGHDIGDKLLQEVSQRMEKFASDNHMIARLGGDEFTVVSQEFSNKYLCLKEAMEFSEQLLSLVKETYHIDRHHLYISASIGVNLIDDSSFESSRFIKEADIAMYEVKSQGRDGVILFNDALTKRVESHLEMERLLHFAIKNGEIALHYQPQMNCQGAVLGCEVLSRWSNAKLGSVGPAEFIPAAEKTGLIIELGNYILEEAFQTLASWEKSGILLQQFSINISVRQFFHYAFVDEVERLCQTYLSEGMRQKIIFEMTESVAVEDIKRIVLVMNRLKRLGIRFSMDDFGTGYSSLSHLKQMPIAEVKIDRSFIKDIGKEKTDQDMIVTILNIAKIFKLITVAEGVETEEQYEFLRHNACDMIQGFYFSKPLNKEDFESFFRATLPLDPV